MVCGDRQQQARASSLRGARGRAWRARGGWAEGEGGVPVRRRACCSGGVESLCLERGDVASCKHCGGALRQSTAAALRRAPHRAVRHCVITPRWRCGRPERHRPVMGAPCRVPSDGSVTELLRARLASGPPSLLTVPQTPVGSRPTMARPPTHGAQRISSIPAGQMIKPGCVTSFFERSLSWVPPIFIPRRVWIDGKKRLGN